MDFEKLMDYRNSLPGFNQKIGMYVMEITNEYVKMEMDIDESHGNPIGSVHGGVIFALADSAGGVAALSHGSYVTTVSGNINYLNPAIKVKKLIATTKELKVGKKILVYDVTITDENERVIAETRMTYYSLQKPVEL